jgi:DNA uptake protein ComE-like DNA-binding protein
LIIVLWIAFGLVSLALYFAQTMSFELRAADQRAAALEAGQAIDGAIRYASNVLATLVEEPGLPPDDFSYASEAVPVGDATFWFLGRNLRQTLANRPAFGLVDEASKLNLNTATAEMLQLLPGMTAEFATAIVDWRDSDSEVSPGGAEDETYLRLNPAYRCKNAPFESVEELRLVHGADLRYLFGEDTNLNGVLDPNENDGDLSPPDDDRDGELDAGLLEYVTVYSAEPNTRADGSARINVNSSNQQALAGLLQQYFGTDRANAILRQIGAPGGGGGGGGGGGPGGGGPGGGTNAPATNFRSLLQFYIQSRMTPDEFAQVEGELTVSTNATATGLVNVNTASEAVLACIPGIGFENAGALVAYRQMQSGTLGTMAWVTEVLEEADAIQAGPYLTGRSYQFSADIVALGRQGRGYQWVRCVFDTTGGEPRLVARQDLTHLGWALGSEVRELLLTARREGIPLTANRRSGGFLNW